MRSTIDGREQMQLRTRAESGPVEEGWSLLYSATVVLKHIRVIIGIPLVLMILVAAGTVLLGRAEYVATSSFLPQVNQNAMSGYSSLASQFGLTLPQAAGAGAGESVAFYAGLVSSRSLLRDVVMAPYPVTTGDAPNENRNLVELWEIDADDANAQVLGAIRRVRESIGTRIDPSSGLITVTSRASDPDLAVQINRRVLDLVAEYNLLRRQSRAGAERQFAEVRLNQARQDLLAAEQEWEEFLDRNRSYQSSPQLSFEAARLQRRTEFQQQVYVSLAQAFEQARIEEVRNTPVITIVDQPEGSAEPADRPIVLWTALALLLGLVASVVVAFTMESVAEARHENPQEYDEFVATRDAAVKHLLPARPLRGAERVGSSDA